jgi:hypothetical protein
MAVVCITVAKNVTIAIHLKVRASFDNFAELSKHLQELVVDDIKVTIG